MLRPPLNRPEPKRPGCTDPVVLKIPGFPIPETGIRGYRGKNGRIFHADILDRERIVFLSTKCEKTSKKAVFKLAMIGQK
jgi:hypothetical protein